MELNELNELFKGFNLKYTVKDLLEHVFATSTATLASVGALKDLVIGNLSEVTNKTTDELNNEFKELNDIHTKEIIADVLTRFGDIDKSKESEQKPKD